MSLSHTDLLGKTNISTRTCTVWKMLHVMCRTLAYGTSAQMHIQQRCTHCGSIPFYPVPLLLGPSPPFCAFILHSRVFVSCTDNGASRDMVGWDHRETSCSVTWTVAIKKLSWSHRQPSPVVGLILHATYFKNVLNNNIPLLYCCLWGRGCITDFNPVILRIKALSLPKLFSSVKELTSPSIQLR